MKKLALTATGVAIVLVGLIAVLYCLPHRNHCHHEHGKCEMKDGDKECSGHEGCEMKERHIEKNWTDGDGKTHHEEQFFKGGENEMNAGACPMHGDMQMGCSMEGMQMQGGCCCCCCMMCKGMQLPDACKKGMDSAKADTTRVKVRGKL